MGRYSDKTVLIDNLLRVIVLLGMTSTALLAPNALQLFDKPVRRYFKKLDDQEREREIRSALRYMKYNRLITENYQHGLSITPKAKKRLEHLDFNQVDVKTPKSWDKNWRIVFFDIPETQKTARDAFASKMRLMGFKVLQRSVFIHPFPCRDEVAKVGEHYKVDSYISYIETPHIDNEAALIKLFRSVLK